MITRRDFLRTLGLATVATAVRSQAASGSRFSKLPSSLALLERTHGGRLGVSVLDTSSGQSIGYRADERFAMCSTFKVLLAAAVLQRVDAGSEQLERALSVPAKPLVGNSPLTEEHAGGEMTVSALCHAILTRSDNTAANLLLATIDGPGGITRFAQSLGDSITRLDRTETSLNQAAPGDPRDTTSPAAMAANLQALLLGKVLAPVSRDRLTQWMIENKTGDVRLRSSLPRDWKAGHKTGSNGETTSNDIAIFWPPGQSPILIAAYLTECPGPETRRSAVLAEVGRLVVDELNPRNGQIK